MTFKEESMIWERKERFPMEETEAELLIEELQIQAQALEEEAYQKFIKDVDSLSLAIRAEEDEVVEAKGIIKKSCMTAVGDCVTCTKITRCDGGW